MAHLANIIVPAWNEAGVISGLLGRLAQASGEGGFRVIVVANACTDDTAAVARQTDPHALVIETPIGGKSHAMNLGYSACLPDLPVVCVDADLAVSEAAIQALISPLQTGAAQAACGRMEVDLAKASGLVKAFYKAWALNPYFAKGKFGGLFAVSGDAAKRVFPLPEVTADDEWVRRSFAEQDRAFVPDCCFVAKAPLDLATLIRLRRRSLRGARAVRAAVGQTASENSVGTMIRAALPRPTLWPAMAVYAAVMILVRLQLKLEPESARTRWERDQGNRAHKAHAK